MAGAVELFDVIGYSGGSVLVTCRHSHYRTRTKFVCRRNAQSSCARMITTHVQGTWVQKGRHYLLDDSHELTAMHRQLSLHDVGVYKCGEAGLWDHKISLDVKTGKDLLKTVYLIFSE